METAKCCARFFGRAVLAVLPFAGLWFLVTQSESAGACAYVVMAGAALHRALR